MVPGAFYFLGGRGRAGGGADGGPGLAGGGELGMPSGVKGRGGLVIQFRALFLVARRFRLRRARLRGRGRD